MVGKQVASKSDEVALNDDVKATRGSKEVLKGNTEDLNGDGKALKSEEEALKGNGEFKRLTKIYLVAAFKGNGVTLEGDEDTLNDNK